MNEEKKIVSLKQSGEDLDVPTLIAMINERSSEVESFAISVHWRDGPTNVLWSEMNGAEAAWHDAIFRSQFMPVFLRKAFEEANRA